MILNMNSSVFEELEELATKANQSDNHDRDEEDSHIFVPTNFLAPSSTFSIMVNLDVLSIQSTKAIKKCGHLVQTVTYSNMQVSVYCQNCNVGDIKSEFSSSKDDVEITTIEANETISKEEMDELTITDAHAHGKKNITDRSCSVDASKYRKNCDQRVTLEESDIEETEFKGSFEVHDSKIKSTTMSSSEKESCNEADNKESGPILLFDTRIEVKTKQETMEIKEENEPAPADIDVSLLSPVVELKEELMDAEDRYIPSQVQTFRVKPLSQLLQTTLDNNESYSHNNQVAEDRYHTNSIPVIDIGDDDEPPSSVSSNTSHIRHVDGGERGAHEVDTSLMSPFPSKAFQHPRSKMTTPLIHPHPSSKGTKPKVDFPGSRQHQPPSYKDGSNLTAAPMWNPSNTSPELASQHYDQVARVSSMADSPGKIQRLSAQNKVAIKNLMQKSRQYQVSGQTPTQNISTPVRNQIFLQSRSPYSRNSPRQAFPYGPGVGSVNQVHPVNDSPGSSYRNSSSPSHLYSSPALNHLVPSPVNHGVQSRVLSPGGFPTKVDHTMMMSNTNLGYPSPNGINEPRSRNPGANHSQGTLPVSSYHMNQRYHRPSPGQPSQAMGASSPVYDVAPRLGSPHVRNSIVNAPPTCNGGPASNLMVMVQVTGVGPQSTPLYLYDPREPLPPGYQAVPLERGWRPTVLQNTERGTPVILTDSQGRQISTGEELLFIKYGMKRL